MDNTARGNTKVKRTVILIALAVLFLVGCAAIFWPDYENPRVIKFLIITQILFIISIGMFLISKEFDFENRNKRLFQILILFALTARLIMLVGSGDKFYHSDDIYRYIWDGKVNAHGINPFVYAPPAPELEHLRDDKIYPKINHPKVPTIYPPMAQNIFFIAYQIGGDTTFVYKLITAFFELLTILALLVWLKRIGVKRNNILLYLFSPLILVEFYMSAHLDILAMPFLIAGLIALKNKRAVMSGLMITLACLVKFLGIFFLPIFFFHFKKKDRLLFFLACVLTGGLFYLPYIFGSKGLFLGSLFNYLNKWQFNASIYNLLKYGLDISQARYIVAALFVLWIIYLLITELKIMEKLFRTYAGYLVLTPTFFPWYYVWLYPLVLVNLSPAFLYISGAVLLSYHVHIGFYSSGEWTVIPWLGIAYYLPFFVIMLWRPVSNLIGVRKK